MIEVVKGFIALNTVFLLHILLLYLEAIINYFLLLLWLLVSIIHVTPSGIEVEFKARISGIYGAGTIGELGRVVKLAIHMCRAWYWQFDINNSTGILYCMSQKIALVTVTDHKGKDKIRTHLVLIEAVHQLSISISQQSETSNHNSWIYCMTWDLHNRVLLTILRNINIKIIWCYGLTDQTVSCKLFTQFKPFEERILEVFFKVRIKVNSPLPFRIRDSHTLTIDYKMKHGNPLNCKKKLAQLPAVDMQKVPGSFCCYSNHAPKLIQPSFDAQQTCGVLMEAWLEHASCQLHAVDQVFFARSQEGCNVPMPVPSLAFKIPKLCSITNNTFRTALKEISDIRPTVKENEAMCKGCLCFWPGEGKS
ncbi:hypothetical protein VP01_1465g3 [Puccinia sorghi]|uniref:Uncharacterized protein n=1 Tax=Puccinia sorghi TaxID=27349 RepID=A0A0L6VKD5_9BASI|nr:hypothetical protein VP01_1465g3 [Puccinia sorghi]